MSISSGYVRIYRQLLGNPALKSNGYAQGFITLILMAAWKPCTIKYRGEPIALKRGQVVISVRDLAELCGQTKWWAEQLLARLKRAEMIISTPRRTPTINPDTNRPITRTVTSIITICNYALYQAETPIAQPKARTQTRTATRTQNKKGIKKESPLPPLKGGRQKAHSIPRNWKPPEVGALSPLARSIAEKWAPEVYDHQGEEFHLWHLGKGDEKVNWRAAFASRIVSLGPELNGKSSDHARRGSHARAGGGSAMGSSLPPVGQLPWEREAAKAAKSDTGNSS